MINTSFVLKKRFLFLLCIACISIILIPLASFAGDSSTFVPNSIGIKSESITQIAQPLTALALISTFLERAIEIAFDFFDNKREKMLEKSRKEIIPRITLVIGIAISWIGIRGLEPFFTIPDNLQGDFFRGVDVILTGTIISGGTAGIHKILTSLTAFLDVTKESAEAEKVKVEAGKTSVEVENAKVEAEKASVKVKAEAENAKAEAEKAGYELEKIKHEKALNILRSES
jgi:hypothetical protein